MKTLMVSCPRSGTLYMSHLWDLHHERVIHENDPEKAGYVSWTLVATEGETLMGSTWKEVSKLYPNHEIVHLVRHPLKCISSMTTIGERWIWDWISKNSDVVPTDSKLRNCMSFWYHWNLKCEAMADRRIRIEDQILDDTLPKNNRRHLEYDCSDLIKEDAELAQKIFNMGERYGYEVVC